MRWTVLADWAEGLGCSRVGGRKWGKAGKPAVRGRRWRLESSVGPCSGIGWDASALVADSVQS